MKDTLTGVALVLALWCGYELGHAIGKTDRRMEGLKPGTPKPLVNTLDCAEAGRICRVRTKMERTKL